MEWKVSKYLGALSMAAKVIGLMEKNKRDQELAQESKEAEEAIAITLEDRGQVIKGQIDLLVVQDALWIVVIEAKHSAFNVMVALPQVLTYMNAASDRPVFGMATNGDEFVFLKLTLTDAPQYDVSRTFSLFPRRHELGEVLQILKRLGQAVLE